MTMLHFCDYVGCRASFPRPSKLYIHKLTHIGCRPYKCEVLGCNKTYHSPDHLKRHMRDKHGPKRIESKEIWVCDNPRCSKVIYTEWGYERHLSIHDRKPDAHKELPFCKECKKTFRYKSVLKKHEKHAHKVVSCSEEGCSETFSNFNLLKSHVAANHKLEFKFICDYCSYEFNAKSNIRNHIQNMHLNENPKSWVCSEDNCGRQFRCKKYLDDHLFRMHQNPKYPCDIKGCKKELRGQKSLERHKSSRTIRAHKSKKSYAEKLAIMLANQNY